MYALLIVHVHVYIHMHTHGGLSADLLQDEQGVVEGLLELLIGISDTQLLKRVYL